LGYGDVPAVTSWEIFLCLFWMLFGEIFYSFIVATYTAIISGQIEIDASIQLRIKSLAELSKLADIPFELSKKIKKFIENNYEAIYNQDDEATIIKMLPPYLRDEVLSNTFGEVVEKIKFFHDMDDVDFLWKVLPLLIPLKIEKSDVVYWQGEYAQDSKNQLILNKNNNSLLYHERNDYSSYRTWASFLQIQSRRYSR
jgi:hyperpolarization activated cyclic nucleotide-gated potassium channel 1